MKLAVVVPSKNEPYLDKTVKDLLSHAKGDTTVTALLDKGQGQRALVRDFVKKTDADYIMKTDAHCSFSDGFDVEMLKVIDDKTILAPILMPLEPISWAVNGKKQMKQFVFDTNFVMQHIEGETGETMCLQGSCFMVSREAYLKWDLDGEDMPSWGGQAVELGIKVFLNGGRCMTTDKAYYGHVFRMTDEEFPYDRGQDPGKEATEILIKKYRNKDLLPLIEKFNFPCDWTSGFFENML